MRTKGTHVDIKEEDIVSRIHEALQFVSYYHPRDFIHGFLMFGIKRRERILAGNRA